MGLLSRFFAPKLITQIAPPTRTNEPRRAVSRVSASSPAPRQVTNTGSYYEALRDSGDRTPIPLGAFNFKTIVRAYNREKLSALGDYLYENCGRVSYAIDTIANYSAPIVPQSASPNTDWNIKADLHFFDWAKRADFTGRFDFWKLQRFMCKAADTAGDIAALATSENGIPQIQLVDGWRIRNHNASIKDHIEGVRVDPKGRVRGYWLDQPNGAIPISPNEIYMFGDQSRYSDYRALSPLRRGSNDIRDVSDIKGFEKVATKIGSALAGVIETESGQLEEDVWGNDTGATDGASPGNQPVSDATKQEKKVTLAELLGGDFIALNVGEKLHQLENRRPGERVPEFLLFLVGEFVCGLGMPPAFFLDEKLTGPNQRAVNGKAQRHFDNRQVDLASFVEWVRNRVIADAIATKQLPAQPGWERMEWNGPARISIDDGKDRQNERDDVQGGYMTYQQHYANRALNSNQQIPLWFAERHDIIKRAKVISAEEGVPIEFCLPVLGVTAPKPTPEKTEAKTTDEDGEKKPAPKTDDDE